MSKARTTPVVLVDGPVDEEALHEVLSELAVWFALSAEAGRLVITPTSGDEDLQCEACLAIADALQLRDYTVQYRPPRDL